MHSLNDGKTRFIPQIVGRPFVHLCDLSAVCLTLGFDQSLSQERAEGDIEMEWPHFQGRN